MRSLLAAFYLACSWLWCIGMFLPVYLVRDFGWPGFVAFAIPNCLGAMSVGFVLSRESSRRLTREHAAAVLAFSFVTIAFQVYFIGAIARGFAPQWSGLIPGNVLPASALSPIAAAVCTITAFVMAWGSTRAWHAMGVAAFGLSAMCALLAWNTSSGGSAYAAPPATGTFGNVELLAAAPAMFFGFLLCPYLDVSFNRTRQEMDDRPARSAFALSFLILFPALILFSLAYAQAFNGAAWLSWYFPLHMAIQCTFTVGVHLREWKTVVRRESGHFPLERPAFARLATGSFRVLWVVLAVIIAMTGALPADSNRFMYELFMSAYGLVFPAYIWTVMMPWSRGFAMHSRVSVWVGTVIAAAPLFWFGYLEKRWLILPIGVAIALAGPLILRLVGVRNGAGSSTEKTGQNGAESRAG